MQDNLNKQQIKNIVISIILIVVAVVVGVILYSSKSPTTELTLPPTSIPSANDEKSKEVVYDYEPGAVTVLQGTIENIAGNTFTIRASEQEKNPALMERSFEVLVDAETKIFLLKGPFSIVKRVVGKDVQTEIVLLGAPGQDETAGQEKQKLRVEDLKIIDQIMILSADDIRGKASFIAKEIYK